MEKHYKLVGIVLLLTIAALGGRTYFKSFTLSSLNTSQSSAHPSLDLKHLQQHVGTLVLQSPLLTQKDRDLSVLGRKIFFDTRLSKNGAVACATCHRPDKNFTDGLQLGHGIGLTKFNTPSIVNSFAMHWFFWDGRADSLAAQALGPLEDPKEHGLPRSDVVRHVLNEYKDDYLRIFGPADFAVLNSLNQAASPLRSVPLVSLQLAEVAGSSVTASELVQRIASVRANEFLDFRTVFNSDVEPAESEAEEAAQNYKSMNEDDRKALDRAFANIGMALEAFQKGIVANQSPFDDFARSWSVSVSSEPADHFSENFGVDEFKGLQIFLGSGACDSCHAGALFSDNQFHNIGLPNSGPYLRLGRSRGVIEAKNSPFNCKGIFATDPDRQASESCKDIPFLNLETPEGLGSFKTPSLRNVSETGPYMHDGRMESLRHVLDHYNRLESSPAIGFREETLKPLRLHDGELLLLEAFLRSLTSEVVDQNLP
jgi:cytochrome c peroxidase